jgi:hypothetical protein
MRAAALLAALLLTAGLRAAAAPAWNVDKAGRLVEGYDLVAYLDEHRATPGRADLSVTLRPGVTACFASPAHRDAFAKDPARYLPAYGGWCAYAMAQGDFVEVDPGTFKVLSGTVHLFYNGWLGNTLKKWDKDEAALKAAADAHWQRLFPAPAKKAPKKETQTK